MTDERDVSVSSWGWHPSPTTRGWWFLGNTSSDEMAGHFFGLGAFLDAARSGAFSDADAARARRLQVDILDNIVTHDLVLLDVAARASMPPQSTGG